jgi:ADP-ribosylglycohydrolase
MILEAAIGDAYGAGFEFRSMDFIKQHNTVEKYYVHGLYFSIFRTYTDDTQMALAIAELLLETEEWTPVKIADKFVEVFHRDKRKGYSDRVYNALDASANGAELLQNLSPLSSGNGSAMRVYALGYIRNIDLLLELAEMQAKVSHNTEEGLSSAKRIALAVHYFLYKQNSEIKLSEFINKTLDENEIYTYESPVDMHGYPTTRTVIKLVEDHDDLCACLKNGIDLGGDTDTVAALSLALLSLKNGVVKNLPSFLSAELEDGKYGKAYLQIIDDKLREKYL